MGTDGSFFTHRLQLCVLPNILWVTELSKPAIILAKNSVCIVAEKKKDFKEIKRKKEQGWRICKKRGKLKLPCDKNGIKCDLMYIHKELSMNLQLRSDHEKYSEAVTKRKNKKILLITNTKSVITCVPLSDCCTNHFVLGLLLTPMKLRLKSCYIYSSKIWICLIKGLKLLKSLAKRGWTLQ